MTRRIVGLTAIALLAASISCNRDAKPVITPAPPDRFRIAGATAHTYTDAGKDLMPGMDNGLQLDSVEHVGRNSWVIWTAGNEMFWDWLSRHGYGTVDFLKLIDSRERGTRFARLGLINDPNLVASSTPDSLGIFLDAIQSKEDATMNPEVYGRPSGIMGLRVYRNPNFDAAARARWMQVKDRFYDPKETLLFRDTLLVRPYVVGMSCGFCHVSFHPLNPPKDPENPKFVNLSTTIGAQYFRSAPIFAPRQDATNFVFQLLSGYREGTLDTSLIASDQVFNPSNMNAIFELGARIDTTGGAVGPETMGPQNQLVPGVAQFVSAHSNMTGRVPHILKDGADNIGAVGALSRVFINIGEYWQQWIMRHDAITGMRMDQEPFSVQEAHDKSDYWNASAARVDAIAKYFLKASGAMRLADAPGGSTILARDASLVTRGAEVFANGCAECHSSKQPPEGTADAKAWFREQVKSPSFLAQNYLSTDVRIKVSDDSLRTNACRAAGTNAIAGHIWDNFSSASYKDTSRGAVAGYEVEVPRLSGATETATMKFPTGGPGYYRPLSLVSLWATAPFLHNNSVGKITHDPSVQGRLEAFDDAIEKLLLLKKRDNVVSRTTASSMLRMPDAGKLPPWFAKGFVTDTNGFIEVGPIPKGTPVALLGSVGMKLNRSAISGSVVEVGLKALWALREMKGKTLTDSAALAATQSLFDPLLKLSNCADLIEDKGHLWGTNLSVADKRALIAYLKRL